MALTRSAGARKDATRGTAPIDVRKAAAIRWVTTGVTTGSTTPLVVGTAGFAYSVGAAGFVASRGASDGVNEYTNDGPLTIACPTAPGSGLSRIDIIWTRHPTAGENGDTTSEPILGVASGTAASSNPAVPSIPTGALELARNTMTSAATSTASAGNTIAQTATTAYLRASAVDDTGVLIPTMVGVWQNFGGLYAVPTYSRVRGWTELDGVASPASTVGVSLIFTLPVGFRILAGSKIRRFPCSVNSTIGTIEIKEDGGVWLDTGTTAGAAVSLSGIRFRALA